jgi:hypothetical protein
MYTLKLRALRDLRGEIPVLFARGFAASSYYGLLPHAYYL